MAIVIFQSSAKQQRMRDSIQSRLRSVKPSRAALIRAAFRWVRIPHLCKIKTRYPNGYLVFMAEDEGFEPPQTESESGVLPLHKSSIARTLLIISTFPKKSSTFLQEWKKTFISPKGRVFLPIPYCADRRRFLFHPCPAA